ncbi:MAG: DUF1343 domain-containing protein [Pseudomonadota bacterium]
MKIGLENTNEITSALKGRKVSVICNMSSVNSNFIHCFDVLRGMDVNVRSIMAPQHGFIMDKQDNMKESPDDQASEQGVPVYSLYGASREPQGYMVRDIDTVVFDLQDVGARYYTFIYTMANAMKVCAKNDIDFVVLDRPNPLNGINVEGGVVQDGFESFVGMYPISNRHGMTIGELALMFNEDFGIGCKLQIVKLEGWNRKKYWDEVADARSWVMPSPNMPSFDTALVYVGQCLLEGTNISEGRGTTRPFEIFGAPFIKHKKFLAHSAIKSLKGVYFRPLYFEPTFNKFAGRVCTGFQIHVTDREKFNSLKTGLAVIYALNDLYPDDFMFNQPPYEYERKKMPIDILLGSDTHRVLLEKGVSFKEFSGAVENGRTDFITSRKKYLLY